MRSLGWVLIQHEWCFYKKGTFGQTYRDTTTWGQASCWGQNGLERSQGGPLLCLFGGKLGAMRKEEWGEQGEIHVWEQRRRKPQCASEAALWKDKDATIVGREEPQMTSLGHCYLSRMGACNINGEEILKSAIKLRRKTEQRGFILSIFSQSNSSSYSQEYDFCHRLFLVHIWSPKRHQSARLLGLINISGDFFFLCSWSFHFTDSLRSNLSPHHHHIHIHTGLSEVVQWREESDLSVLLIN